MPALTPRQMWRLDEACRPIRQVFDALYLVGTAQNTRQYRDVDVRLMLDDDKYDSLAAVISPGGMALLGIVFGEYLEARTGLPIDFQVQRNTEANANHPGVRNPLGLRTLANYRGDGAPEPKGRDDVV